MVGGLFAGGGGVRACDKQIIQIDQYVNRLNEYIIITRNR